jgi:RHS repeat-associated protein
VAIKQLVAVEADTAAPVRDCTSYPASGCTPIQWPGERTTPRHELEKDGNIQNWFGGLVDGMRDASGQMYMRNRYYDPATGQFTQPDPIGLAGGLNSYGFAAGDPVTFSDPYGLCPAHLVRRSGHPERVCPGGLTHGEYYQKEDGFGGQEFTPTDNSISSTCRADPLCAPHVRWANADEFEEVQRTIRRRIPSTGFCGVLRQSALDAINRGLGIIPRNLGYVGEAPYAFPPYPRPGHLMFLAAGQLRNGHAVAHEGGHATPFRGRFFAHFDMTPMGVTMEDAAAICTGNQPPSARRQ